MKRIGRPKSTPESFWRKVDRRGPDDCWLWKNGLRNGYGHHCVNKVSIYAHRYAYLLHNGSVPEGRDKPIMHTCNDKRCCNPAHLVVGSPGENTRDAYRDGLAKAGQRHPYAKFSSELVEAVRRDQRPQLELERIYGISQQHISRIKNWHTRKHEAVNG